MSRGFVKEEDQESTPMVPPRADLPNGITNYVTAFGLQALLDEREQLQIEKDNLSFTNEQERRIAVNFLQAKLQLLSERIASAKVVDLNKQPLDEIRFGAHITLCINDQQKPERYQIVGVDEANISLHKIGFTAPIAKLLINKKIGEKTVLKLGTKNRTFKVLAISYNQE
ncbi:GreA/GreB family elongation factor [Flavobacterium antarcticum]|uniref:GreA/GreB family elongation factor n=1 Tax=Flavobacterium antarcticum TaxID=271155 RepID=UPI0003B4B1AA|nr:GreA/GreB family elongation factor [Flavobacterium antarcticum]